MDGGRTKVEVFYTKFISINVCRRLLSRNMFLFFVRFCSVLLACLHF